MPIFITTGRYTQGAVKAMIAKPEDRSKAVAAAFRSVGGKLIAYYVTFGEDDFMVIAEAPSAHEAAQVLFTVGAGGFVTNTKTILAMSAAEAKEVFKKVGKVDYRTPKAR